MKNKFFILLILTTLTSGLFSCGDDDKESSSGKIVGKWQASSQETFDCPTTTDNGTLTCGAYAFCYTIEFKSNNTFEMIRSGNNIGSGTYGVSESNFSLSFTSNPFGFSDHAVYSFTISGSSLTTVYAPGTNCKTRAIYQKTL